MAISDNFQKLEQSVNSTLEAIQFNLRVCLSLLQTPNKAGGSSNTPSGEAAVPQTMARQFRAMPHMMNKSEVGDKAVNQLEELVNSKLNATIAQFQTSAKQVLEDALRPSMESTVVPYFMRKRELLFDQVVAEFRKQIDIYSTAPQQHYAYSSLADALREAMSSLSSVTQTVSRKLADEQRNLADFSTKMQLSRLVSERKYEEAFKSVLQGDDGGDIGLLSWLCTQVNLHDILKLDLIPLSVLSIISLHARLKRHYNISHDASVLEWMSHLIDALKRIIDMGSRIDTYRGLV